MKIILLFLVVLVIVSCEKKNFQLQGKSDIKLEAIKYIESKISVEESKQFDFTKPQIIIDKNRIEIAVRFTSKIDKNKFLLASKSNDKFKLNSVHLNLKFDNNVIGTLSASNLESKVNREIHYENNQIFLFENNKLISQTKKNQTLKRSVGDNVVLEEVIVNGYYNNKPVYFIDYSWLINDFNSKNVHYLQINNETSGGGDDSGLIEFDEEDKKEKTELEKLLNCLMKLAKLSGSTFKVTLFSDVPVNQFPSMLIDNANPGHAFIGLSVLNGGSTYTQYFGFYPEHGYKSLSKFPVNSIIVNDREHEFNASISRTLTLAEFNSIVMYAGSCSLNNYDLNEYNCTDYALGLYNYGLNSPIFSEKIINPVPFNFAGLSPNMNTPQGLYLSIKKQFENGNSNARIRGDGEKVGLGLGECNK